MVPDTMKQQLLIYQFSARVRSYMSRTHLDMPGPLVYRDYTSILALLEQEFMDLSRSISRLTGK
jgi:hypothetical protein